MNQRCLKRILRALAVTLITQSILNYFHIINDFIVMKINHHPKSSFTDQMNEQSLPNSIDIAVNIRHFYEQPHSKHDEDPKSTIPATDRLNSGESVRSYSFNPQSQHQTVPIIGDFSSDITHLYEEPHYEPHIFLTMMRISTFIMFRHSKHSSFTALLWMMISAVSGQHVYYDTAYQCVGGSWPMDRDFNLHSRGYKTISGGTTDITIDWISYDYRTSRVIGCKGSFGCANLRYITGSNTIPAVRSSLSCWGSFSCANTTMNITGAMEIFCSGANSCNGVTFDQAWASGQYNGEVECAGDQSCANTEFHNIYSIRAYGAYALYNATIRSTNATIHDQIRGLSVYLYALDD